MNRFFVKRLSVKTLFATLILLTPSHFASAKVEQKNDTRIISAGNGITEIIYALGAGDLIVAVDSTSKYPNAVHQLPRLGYHRQLSAEGILALKPSLLIGTSNMGPPATMIQLEMVGLKIHAYPALNSTANIKLRITKIARLLNKEAEGKKLWDSIQTDLNKAQALSKGRKKPRVIFLLAMGEGTSYISGSGTAADSLIEIAGGINPARDQFVSYKLLSKETLLTLDPDIILFADQGNATTIQQLLDSQPILKQTPAGKSSRAIHIEAHLLLGGLGPRTGSIALNLAKQFPDYHLT